MNSSLKQIVFADDGVEKWLHVYSAILIPVEFQKSWCAKKMPKFEREFGCDCEEGIVIESLFVIVGRGEIFPQQLVQLL